MIIPAALQSGDTIALISPASQVKHHYIDAATRRLEEWGFRVLKGEHVYDSYGNFAGTAEQRLSDLREALCNPDVKAILCTRGGYGAVHLLEGITPEEIRRNAKWLIGFSDISALHAAWVRAGVASLHASMAKHLTEEGDDHVVTRYFRDILAGQRPCYYVASHPFNKDGSVSARIVGGNMAVLCGLLRTPYDIFSEGTILFIEDVGERTYKVERMLYNLELAGVLPHLAGLIVGRFTEYDEDPGMRATMYEMIASRVSRYGYPVCFDFPVGHVTDNYPIIEGVDVAFTVASQGVTLEF